ncbi:MAG TPA: hypothetical protein VFV73_22160 [Streptosporangiaceae bacterium]|nr:hypothetical protein [Streptosporangiaceae bacterium]
MTVLWRSRRLVRLAGGTALALTLTGTVAATAAPAQAGQARGAGIVIQSHVVAGWGRNGSGQLGDGTTTDRSLTGDDRFAGDVVQVAAGWFHGLALRSDGTVWAWGINLLGELGDGSTTNRSAPVQVQGLTGVTQVAAGREFSLALRSDGTVWAWGDNQNGQLGRGTISDHEVTPVRVSGLADVTRISAGMDFGLALRSDGTVRAWGDGQLGQLGSGVTADSPVPVTVAGLAQVTGIAAGWDSSVATRTSGISAVTSVWTWGGNDFGQLGDGTLARHATPERVTGLPVYIAGIAAGGGFAVVLSPDGSVWGWGTNTSGQLGTSPTNTPVTRPVNVIGAGRGIIQLAAGSRGHVLALRSDGAVLGWGSDGFGELGDGTTTPFVSLVQVTGLTSATQVAAGRSFSLAVHTVPFLVGQGS